MPQDRAQRRRNIRTALLLLALVAAVYIAFFISMSVR
jgi:hypothetical protein